MRRGVWLVGIILLAGCAAWRQEPLLLPWPTRPVLDWSLCYSVPDAPVPDRVCLAFEDGDKLVRYLDKLSALESARRRLVP